MNKPAHNPYIDGLRGIAILMVICYHYFTGFYIFDFGWTGVDLFFVLSGYLLTGRIYPYLNRKKIILKFYVNRFLRIAPLYYTFLIIFFGTILFFGSESTIQNFSLYLNHKAAVLAFLTNWLFIFYGTGSADHLSHLWSLAVEEQFYLVFPLFIFIFRNKKALLKAGIIIMLIIFITRILFYLHYSGVQKNLHIYWNTFFRADSFLAGFMLYIAIENGFYKLFSRFAVPVIAVCIATIAAGCLYYGTMRLNPFFTSGGFLALEIAFASILFLAINERENIIKKITHSSFLKATGKISYGMYIFHWPVFLLSFSFINKLLSYLHLILPASCIQIINALVSIIISYAISYVSFRFFESKFLKLKSKYR